MGEELPTNNGGTGMGEGSGANNILKENSVKEEKTAEWQAQDDGERIVRPADRLRPWRVRCV